MKIPELDTSVFVIPSGSVKIGEARLVVLNRIAKSDVESVRGDHPVFVFTFGSDSTKRRPVKKMNNAAWKSARERAANRWSLAHGNAAAPEGFRRRRVHDLKHAFGRRLREGSVSFEDSQVCSATRVCELLRTTLRLDSRAWLRRRSKECPRSPQKSRNVVGEMKERLAPLL